MELVEREGSLSQRRRRASAIDNASTSAVAAVGLPETWVEIAQPPLGGAFCEGVTQVLALVSQMNPPRQSALEAHPWMHAPAAHRDGLQSRVVPSAATIVRSSEQVDSDKHLPVVASQCRSVSQSESRRQLSIHAVAPQMNGAQACVTALGHAPDPLQEAAATSLPAVHAAVRQLTDAPTKPAHFAPSFPSQTVAVHGSLAEAAAHAPCDAEPLTGVQVPVVPSVEHDSHTPSQARLQQTPSEQCPVSHSTSVLQVVPCTSDRVRTYVSLVRTPSKSTPPKLTS
jgi:hypothetical protein